MMLTLYKKLLKAHGRQDWWPVRTKNNFEICIGAILTQNTNWKNVEKAIGNLIEADAVDEKKISSMQIGRLEKLIRPSGFFRQKSRRLKEFSRFVISYGVFDDFVRNVSREDLLKVKGIGKETADSILLYACSKPYFVVDSYTRRMLAEIGLIKGDEPYDEIREMIEDKLPRDLELYKEFHALIVEHMKKKRA
jgi:endonuclease-3 related protein